MLICFFSHVLVGFCFCFYFILISFGLISYSFLFYFFHYNEVPIYTQFFKVYNVLPFVLFNRDMMIILYKLYF